MMGMIIKLRKLNIKGTITDQVGCNSQVNKTVSSEKFKKNRNWWTYSEPRKIYKIYSI